MNEKSTAANVSFWRDFLSKPVFQRSESDTDHAVSLLRDYPTLQNASDEALETLSKHIVVVDMTQGQRLETVQLGHESRFIKPCQDMLILLDGRVHWSFPAQLRHARIIGHVFGAGDEINGSKLIRDVLPTGSNYICEQRGTISLVFPEEHIQHVVQEHDDRELQIRMAFLRTLTVPLVTTWSNEEVAELAKSFVPMRLASHTVVVREHEASDAVYFVRAGKLKVVREIDFSSSSSGGGQQPNAKLLELATLCPGEYFGELGILSRDVDAPKATTLNKQEILALVKEPLLKTGAGTSSSSFTTSSPSSSKTHSKNTTSSAALTAKGTGTDNVLAVDSSVVKTRINENTGEPMLITRPRQATVYAHTVVELLMLPVEAFENLFVKSISATRAHATVALLKMREYALGYPTQSDVKSYFLKQKKWSDFKGSILSSSPSSGSTSGSSGALSSAAAFM